MLLVIMASLLIDIDHVVSEAWRQACIMCQLLWLWPGSPNSWVLVSKLVACHHNSSHPQSLSLTTTFSWPMILWQKLFPDDNKLLKCYHRIFKLVFQRYFHLIWGVRNSVRKWGFKSFMQGRLKKASCHCFPNPKLYSHSKQRITALFTWQQALRRFLWAAQQTVWCNIHQCDLHLTNI